MIDMRVYSTCGASKAGLSREARGTSEAGVSRETSETCGSVNERSSRHE